MPSASALSRSWTVIRARASVFAGGVLAEEALQGAPVHVATARRLRRRSAACYRCSRSRRHGRETPGGWRLYPGSWLLLRHRPLCSLEDGIWPAYRDRRAAAAAGAAVAEDHRRAGALQQRLGDENAQAHMSFLALARRNEGRSQFVEQRLREARPVVGDLDLRPLARPARDDGDFAPCERDGVLHDVADALHDLRAAHLDRRRGRHAIADRPGLEGDGDVFALI